MRRAKRQGQRTPAFHEAGCLGALLVLGSLISGVASSGETIPEKHLELSADSADQWVFYGGKGGIKDKQLVLDGRRQLSYAIFKPFEWADLTLEARFKLGPASQGVPACGFLVRAKDGNTYYYVRFGSTERVLDFASTQAVLGRAEIRDSSIEIKHVSGLTKPAGKWHQGAVACSGSRIRVSLNGKLLYEAKDAALKAGRIGFYAGPGLVNISDVVVHGAGTPAAKEFQKPRPPFVGPMTDAPGLEMVDVRRIWDRAPHNAFTDLVRFRDRWWCVFREGKGHVSPDGALRVLTSTDGQDWESAARMTSKTADLRDAKACVTPAGELMLSGAGALHDPEPIRHQSMAWFSQDGRNWPAPVKIGDPNLWLWSVTWHNDAAYGIGYSTVKETFIRLYRSTDGRKFETLVETLHDESYPNETSLVFTKDDTGYCLLRRGGTGLLGQASPPYTEWVWKDLGMAIGGPKMIQLPDGRFLATVRLYDRKVRTSLCWVDPEAGRLLECYALPSGGDTSYAGMALHDGLLWVSYYSSHEGKTSIYLAKLKLIGEDQ